MKQILFHKQKKSNNTQLYQLNQIMLFFFISDLVELLLEFGASQSQHVRPVTLILRNLCFHASNKPKLLTYGEPDLRWL